jgi:hypothetical protein
MPITDFVDTSHPHITKNQIREGDIGQFDKTVAAGGRRPLQDADLMIVARGADKEDRVAAA